jgi:NADPH2:quinone reductase
MIAAMKYVEVPTPGDANVLRISEMPTPQPKANEVLLEVFATGMNRPDIAQRKGLYLPPKDASPILGLEVSGRVVGLGPGSSMKIGSDVCALVPGGGYAQFCVVSEQHCLPIPKEISLIEAAGIPETFFTVWANVFITAGLKDGDRFLVHGGSSGIGTTAIQLARSFGAEVFATAGSDSKCKACIDLGANYAINYKQSDFCDEIKKLTSGNGVDIILDMIGGAYTAKNIDSLASQGRIVQIATMQGAEVSINLVKLMQKRAILTGSTLRPRSIAEKATIAKALREKVWPLLETKKVRVVVDKVFPLSEVAHAHAYMESSHHVGKIILSLKE